MLTLKGKLIAFNESLSEKNGEVQKTIKMVLSGRSISRTGYFDEIKQVKVTEEQKEEYKGFVDEEIEIPVRINCFKDVIYIQML